MSNNDPLDLPAGQMEQDAAKATALQAARQERDDLKWLMSDKRGRRIMWVTLAKTGLFSNPFRPQREVTDFNCGMQNIGQLLLAQVTEHCPQLYSLMTTENSK